MYRIVFHLIPEFSLISVVCALETLRVTNSLYDQPPYHAIFAHDSASKVPSSNGLHLQAEIALKDLRDFDALIACGSFKPHRYENADSQAAYRRWGRHGKMLGCMETGAYHLAKAGVLNGHRATAHFNSLPLFSRMFPKVRFAKQVYTISDTRMSCAGGISATDMMMALIRRQLGWDVAARVANLLVMPYLRDADEPQGDLFTSVLNDLPQSVRNACRLMEEKIASPLAIPSVASKLNISRRQLDRLFRAAFDCTASDYYLMIRLGRARKLLKASGLGLESVAESCGFRSYAHFARCYRGAFGLSPSSDRGGSQQMHGALRHFSPLFDLHPYQNLLDPQRLL